MDINGLQKLTLLDYPGKTACTVFLAGCDFRCPFFHNSERLDGSAPVEMRDEELLRFLRQRRGLLDSLCFTGGEPSLRGELPQLCEKIKELGYNIKVDTNGNHPDAISRLIDAGLVEYVAMDIKNSPARYAQTAGLETLDLSAVNESIAMLIASPVDYEFRTTTVEQLHDADSFRQIGPWIKGAKQYFIQAFVDRDTVVYSGFTAPPEEKLREYADIVRPFVGSVSLRGV
jgi:pyruvate formate lyase activating enzyme